MIMAKVCMLGAFAVGKTSLVNRFVQGLFEDKYLTTVGVNMKKKVVDVAGKTVTMTLWDLAGEDAFQTVQMNYVRGSAGFLLVIDGTRRSTLDTATSIQQRVEAALGPIPFAVIVNKADLEPQWEITPDDLAGLTAKGWSVLKGSAKTGAGVDDAFLTLARAAAERAAG